jgi:ABC-type polysaccharide/polyol phosphate transport system ATPase subunit
MIGLDAVSLTTGYDHGRRVILDRASFAFTPGLWHVAAEPASDARHLVQFLAGSHRPVEGNVACRGPRSWPLAQFAPFGPYLSGLDIIDTLCSLYALERRETFHLFHALFSQPDWLAVRFDRWPVSLRRRFGHIAFLAPAFEVYLLDATPVLPDRDFYRRWRTLFLERVAGKVTIIASGEHRAALRDFPGERLLLSGGKLRRVSQSPSELAPTMAAE